MQQHFYVIILSQIFNKRLMYHMLFNYPAECLRNLRFLQFGVINFNPVQKPGCTNPLVVMANLDLDQITKVNSLDNENILLKNGTNIVDMTDF